MEDFEGAGLFGDTSMDDLLHDLPRADCVPGDESPEGVVLESTEVEPFGGMNFLL